MLALRAAAAAAAVAGAGVAGRASAAPDDWIAGSGLWNTAADWSAGVPVTGTDALIVSSDAVNRVVTYSAGIPYPTLNSLQIDNTGAGGVNTLTQSSSQLMTYAEFVGYNGQGVYNLNGSALGNYVYATAPSGTNNALFIGFGAASNGTYNQSGSTLSVATSEYLGYSGHGTFNQTNGAHTVSGGLYLGANGGGVGTYNLSGGTLSVFSTEYLGANGTGTFNQSAGSHTASQLLDIGLAQTASGTYAMTGGSLAAQSLAVGDLGSGRFVQSGNSTVSVTGTNSGSAFWVGASGGGAGSYAIGGTGTAVLNIAGSAYIGYAGNGSMSQSAGSSVTFGTNSGFALEIGKSIGSSGTYALSGGVLTANGAEYIGEQGHGTFNQTGGVNQANNGVLVSYNDPNGVGVYTLSGGTLTAGWTEQVGCYASGSFIQSGGVNTLNGALDVGGGVGTDGSYTLSGGRVAVDFDLYMAEGVSGGRATFTQSGSATANIGGSVYLAYAPASSATYSLGGTASLVSANSTYVGYGGNGSFVQTGGTHAVNGKGGANGLYIGYSAGASGVYNLSGGSLSVTNNEYAGYGAPGTFIQSGGTNLVGNVLWIGFGNSASGTYVLSGGTLLCTNTEYIGNDSPGTFVQSGGTNSMSSLSGGGGSYSLSGGVLTASAEYFGNNGNTSYTQTGGLNAAPYIAFGNTRGETALATISGGTLSATNFYVGGYSAGIAGLGTLYVSNTANVVINGPLIVYPGTATSGGTVHFSGGAITATALNLFNTPSLLDWTGGTFNLTGTDLTFAAGGVAGGASMPFGAIVTLNASQGLTTSGNETIGAGGALTLNGGTHGVGQVLQLNAGGSLTVTNGGTLSFGTLSQSGGAFGGDLLNRTNYNYFGGSLAGALRNQGVATINASFAPTGGIDNSMTMNVAPGVTVTPGGFGFLNEGTVSFTNATLAGATLSNDGILNGSGAITAPLVNGGTLNVTGLLTAASVQNLGSINVPGGVVFRASSLLNAGAINLSAGSSAGLSGQPLTNQPGGSIAGAGSVRFDVTNGGGLIVASDTTAPLTLYSLTGNQPGGELRAADGATLNVLSPFTNSGLISLNGPGATFGGGAAVSNAGTIQGVGRFSNPLTNTGVVRGEGGQLTFFSPVTNAAGGQVQAPTGGTVMFSAGLANTLGTIALAGGAVDTSNQTLTNGGLIAGNGILRTGGLLNSGTVILSDLASQVYGPVTNGGSLKIVSNTTTFYGPVTNNGTLKTTAATARFLAPFVNNGVYTSDPSEQSFTDLTVGPDGALVGDLGDRFTLTGDFHSSSARPAVWQTDEAALEFAAGGASPSHVMDVQGTDRGGYVGNFAWGDLVVEEGQSLVLSDGDATPGGALYARVLNLAGVGADVGGYVTSHLINADASDLVNVYYDPMQPANAYLGGGTYALGNGGTLSPALAMPTPEPGSTCLAGVAAAVSCLGVRRRRPRR